MKPIRLLTFTTLFPNAEHPNHGVFVENRLCKLVETGAAESTVLAPVPYFPSLPALHLPSLPGWPGRAAAAAPGTAPDRSGWRGNWRGYARIPALERRSGLVVHHPRYPVIPRFGMSVAPLLLYRACIAPIARLLAQGGRFDLIDAHYFYPDGIAATWLGRHFGLPVAVTARGSDVTLLPRYPVPRLLLRRAARRADGLVAVSEGLKQALVALGARPESVTVLRNGVDATLFRPVDRQAARAALGLTRPTLLSVGHLIERKGHHRVIAAMRLLPDCDLLIVGEGPERGRLEAMGAEAGLAGRVSLLGARPHRDLPPYYAAADVLVLASSREGWANVLLEAMACGTPVVASPIPGNPEVVREPAAGLIAARNTPEAIAAAVRSLLAAPPTRAATRAYAERFGWEATTEGQLALFRAILARTAEHADAGPVPGTGPTAPAARSKRQPA